ncbi:serine hydrolase [Acuticoccus sp. M5D2P5]|uniref:serine hydrolase n=1 Tax=Acuticoccus kalidii TaxID=2910977 RepID=UPI001F1A62AE|nr:serine hydrolase [Acuticoccus kalidii]MCF3936195.1 serine hydrolase [Acuticoccus kalidii]
MTSIRAARAFSLRNGLRALLAIGVLAAPIAAEADEAVTKERIDSAVAALDGIAETILERTDVPGLAVAVVHDGTMIYSNGFGVLEVGKAAPVRADTVFQIASLSKSLAASVVAHQVGEGAVAWNTPVQTLMPDFALADPWVSEHVTVGDLFAHRSGLPDHAGDDLELLGYGRQAILDRLRLLPLNAFRDSYAYTNFGLTAAAEAVARNAGTEWESLSDTVLYAPLGMGATSSRFADFAAIEDRAVGHTLIDGAFAPVTVRMPDPQSPAGGVSSTVEDFARWMIMVLDEGRYEGEDIVKNGALLPALTPQSVSDPTTSAASLPSFYGFGVGVGTRGPGVVALSHSGAFVLGAATTYVMLPSEKLGIVVFTNALPIGAPEAVSAEFIDLVINGEVQRDWLSLFRGAIGPLTDPVGEYVGKTPPSDAAPAGPLADYTGVFESAYFGKASVALDGETLTLTVGEDEQHFALSPWSGDIFTFPVLNENMPHGSISAVTFDRDGAASTALTIEFLDENGLGRFDRAEP